MAFGGLALRTFTTVFYAIALACAVIVLGVYGYFMAALNRNDLPIADWIRATTGIAGGTTAYLIFPVLLTCFFGATKMFACIGILLNLVFIGGFIAMAIMTRDGANSCNGFIVTPVGDGFSIDDAPGFSDYHYACKLNRACFAVSIIGIFALVFASLSQMTLRKHRERERLQRQTAATAGYGATAPRSKKFWQRAPKQPAATETAGYNASYNPGYVEAGMAENKNGYAPAAGTAYPK